MKNSDQKLSDIFDIAPAINVTPALVPIVDEGVESDFDFARKNIRDLVEKGNTAVDNILQVASATDHPRAYEVASNMIKQLGDLNRDLLSLQKIRKELSPQALQTTVNVDKAVFVGSTAELIKQIKGIQ
jgi:hypothetical protein